MNRVIGIGLEEGPLDEGELARVEAAWWGRGEAVRIEVSTLADPAIGVQLTGRGYRLVGFENVLGRPLDGAEVAVGGAIAIEVVDGAADAALWREVAITGFSQPDGTGAGHDDFSRAVLERVFDDVRLLRGTRDYLARIDGVAVGAAAIRIDRGLAVFSGATTLPAARGRGVHGAMLAGRLAAARRAGCDLAVVVTAPGTRSQENVQRHGFDLLYSRAVLVRQPDVAR
jgi:GNAT superfamily N-acetyltransferase